MNDTIAIEISKQFFNRTITLLNIIKSEIVFSGSFTFLFINLVKTGC